MTVGMLFAAMAFVCAALVQIEIDVSVKSVNQIQVFTFRKSLLKLHNLMILFPSENIAKLPIVL